MKKLIRSNISHGILFGEKHSWKDWNIVPTTRPVIAPPNPKLIKIEIPGADGEIDLTEAVSNDVKYYNRIGSLEFQVENPSQWGEVYSEIMDYIHGQQMKAVLDDNPDYYYFGRFFVNEWKSEKNRSLIVIDYDLDPYKYERYSSSEDWAWDSFNLETGIIRNYRDIMIDGTYTLQIQPTRKVIVPIITVKQYKEADRISVRYGWGDTYVLENGKNVIYEIKISTKNKYNMLTFSGKGVVTVEYRGARL